MKRSRGARQLADGVARSRDESAVLDGQPVTFDATRAGGRLEAIRVGEDVFRVRVARATGTGSLSGAPGDVPRSGEWLASRRRRVRGGAQARVACSLPCPAGCAGSSRRRGRASAKGDVILILEAMKMEHAIRAPRDGRRDAPAHREGDLVDAGAVLAEISREFGGSRPSRGIIRPMPSLRRVSRSSGRTCRARVTVYEVGPRDGLQNESETLPVGRPRPSSWTA